MIRLPLVLALLAATSLTSDSLTQAADDARPKISALPDIPASVHAAMQRRDFDAAVKEIDARLQDEGDNRDYLMYLKGRALTEDGRLDEASAAYLECERRFPKSRWTARSRFGRADVLVRQRNYRAAGMIYQAEAQRLLSEDRRDELSAIYLEFADRYFDGDKQVDPTGKGRPDYKQALTYYQESLKLKPSLVVRRRTQLRIAHAHRELGQLDEAISSYQSFLTEFAAKDAVPAMRAPESMEAQARYQLGQAQLAGGQHEAARRTWQDFLASNTGQAAGGKLPEEAAYRIAHTYRLPEPASISDLELGVAAHETFLKTYPKSELAPQAALEIAQSYSHHRRFDQSVERLKSLIETVDASAKQIPLARNLLGQALASQKKFTEAITAWREFLDKHPSDPHWSNVQRIVINTEYAMAESQRSEKNFAAARELWVTFLNKYPLDGRAPEILFLFGQMKFSAGITSWNQEIDAAKADGKVVEGPVEPKAKTRKLFEEAIADWQRLVSKYPGTEQASRAAFAIGTTREDQLGQLAQSLDAYRKVTGNYQDKANERIANLTAKQLEVITERKFRTDEVARVKVRTRNVEQVSVRMYRIDMVDYFRKMHLATGVESLDIALIDPDKTWDHSVTGYEEFRQLDNEIEIPVEGSGVTAVTITGQDLEATTMVVVSDLDVIVKSSRNELFVFAQNSRTGKPQTGTSILVSDGEKVFAEDVTGKDGILQKSFEELKSVGDLRVFAVHEGNAASTVNNLAGLEFAVGLAPKGYLFVDRPAYRAGQLVNLKGIVRWVSEDRYTFKAGEKYQLDVYDARGRLIHSKNVALSRFGTVADHFELPESSPEGMCRVCLHQAGGTQSYETTFRVHEYQLQSVRLEIEVPQQVYYRGETIEGTVSLKYYYGTPLAGKTVTWQLADGRQHTGTTDARGEIKIEFPTRDFSESQELGITAHFAEKNLSASSSVRLATRGFAVGVSTRRNVYISGETFDSTIAVNDPSGEPVATKLTLEVFERTLVNGKHGERKVDSFEIASNKETGEATRTLRIDEPGNYTIRATGTDQFGNRLSGSHGVSISGDDDRIRLRLLADRHQYTVGDTVDVSLHWREGPALALVTYEGASILGYQLVSLKQGANKLTVPMDSKLAPNFNLSVAVMHGNRFHETGSEFRVTRKLNIRLKPDRKLLKPGENLNVEITTTDPQGKPVSAEVSLGLVQQNLWQMYGDDVSVIDQFFGGGQRQPQVRAISSCTFAYSPETRPVNEFLLAEQDRQEQAGRNAVARLGLKRAQNQREVAGMVDRFNDLVKQRRYSEALGVAKEAQAQGVDDRLATIMLRKSQLGSQLARHWAFNGRDEGRKLGNDTELYFSDEAILANGSSTWTEYAGSNSSRLRQQSDGPDQLFVSGTMSWEGSSSWGIPSLESGQTAGELSELSVNHLAAIDQDSNGDGLAEADFEQLRAVIVLQDDSSSNGIFDYVNGGRSSGVNNFRVDHYASTLSLVIQQSQEVQGDAVQGYFQNLSLAENTIVALNDVGEFQVVNGLPVAMLRGLAESGMQILPRMASAELGYWNPTIVTDENGQATRTFRLPDRSTAWTLKSRGIDGDALSGQVEVDIVAKKDLFGELRTPLAFVDGDIATVLVEVHNSTVEKGQPIEVLLKTTQGEKATEIRRVLESAGSGVQEISVPVLMEGDLAAFELTVKSGDLIDVLNHAVPIRPFGLPVLATTSGTSAQSTIIFVEHEGQIGVQDSQLELHFGPGIDRTLLEGVLGSSIGNTSVGIERSVSDVLGGANLLKLIARSRAADSPESIALTARINSGISQLVSSQRDDGSWSWSGRHNAEGDRYATSRAAWALSVARRGGFAVPTETLASAVSSLNSAFSASGTADREGQAIILHGLAEADAADFAWANRLYRERNSLSVSGLLHVALAMIRLDRKEMAEDLVELVKLPFEAATANRNEQSESVVKCIPWMRSGVELRALYLLAVEELFPTDKSAAKAADWLMAARTGYRWSPEKSNGPAMMALAEWFSKKKFSTGKYKLTVQVNDNDVETIEVDPAVDPTRRISVPSELVVAGKPQKIGVTMDGRGEFSFSAILSGFVPADNLQSTTQEWRVSRYSEPAHRMFDGEVIPRGFHILTGGYSTFRNPLTQLPVGDRAEVTLQVRRNGVRGTKDEQLDYLIVEEPLPAGTSVLRESIKGSFERFEIGANSITFFIGDTPHPSDIHYTLVGHLPGTYRTVPTVVRSFYRPQEIAVASGTLLEVLPQTQPGGDEYRLSPVELFEFGKRLLAKNDHKAAGEHLTELFTKYRLNSDVYKQCVEMLFRTSLQTNLHRDIVQYFEIIKEKYSDVELDFDSIMKVATAYQELGEYERSYLVFRATIESAFERESQIAGFLTGQNEFVRSVEVVERLLHEYPSESYVAVATFALAGEVYSKAATVADDAKLKDAGITRVDLIDSSIRMHDHLLSTWPNDPASDRVSFSLASAVLDLEQHDQVIRRCRDFSERFPESEFLDSFWYVIGYSQFALGNHEAALEMCRKVSDAKRKDKGTGIEVAAANKWQAIYIMGQIYHSLGKPSEAITEYERVKERFSDATEAIDFFTRKDIALPEVTTVKPGAAGAVELSFRNVKQASIKVYRIDLLKFGLMQRNLNQITAINLAGIRPYHEMTTKLGDGNDFRDRTQELKLPLKEEGAYLVVCRGENLYTSGLVLVSPLQLEIQEDSTSGRVRVTVKDSVQDRYLKNVLVKVIGSANSDFNTGETDLRGIFVADAIRGTSTIIARAEEDRYAFYRGTQSMGNVAQPQSGKIPEPAADEMSGEAKGNGQQELLKNLFDTNGEIQGINRGNYDKLLNNSIQGVKAELAY
ncbi:MAG: tetratricopeptide repeat protein [Planctomycetota bacterium]|nr:tetratricopeptide repeat protein [Planctomycetota bacterium]